VFKAALPGSGGGKSATKNTWVPAFAGMSGAGSASRCNRPFTWAAHDAHMLAVLAAVLVLAFPALVIVAALRDTVSYTIPNWISLALIGIFPLAALATGLPLPQLGLHVVVGFLALIAGIGMFAMRWIGGGDAKLFAAAALWLGWPAAVTYLAATGIAGGALALSLLAIRSMWLRRYASAGPAWLARLAEPGENVPYGLAIAIGALAAFPASPFAAAFEAIR
jgi:prepilin peptidase CpaA